MTEINKTSEVNKSDVRDVKRKTNVVSASGRTFVILAAIAHDSEKNTINRIRCGLGIPYAGYVYDSVRDCYNVNCTAVYFLGEVPVAMQLKMENVGYWSIPVPMPEVILKRYLTDQQKLDLKSFRSSYPSDSYDVHYIQFYTWGKK